jgi:hypothetical protein
LGKKKSGPKAAEIKTDEKDNPWSRGKANFIACADSVRDHRLEQYLSKNRMNRRLQTSLKTAFSGLTRAYCGVKSSQRCNNQMIDTMPQIVTQSQKIL